MKSQIFISYSKKDRDFAWKLADDLINAGHKVWIDRSLQVGENWEQTIEKNLGEADEVIVVLSLDAIASKWVQHEGSIAYGLKKQMYPVLIEALSADDLPLWVSKFQYHSFVDIKYEEAFKALNAVLTPPNPIQDLLDQQVVVYQQTGELMGEAILRVIEENRHNLTISNEAAELIQKSQQSQERTYLRQRRRNRILLGISLIAMIFGIVAVFLGIQSRQQAHVALARSLNIQAKEYCDLPNDDMKMRCMLLSIESLERFHTSDAMLNLHTARAGLNDYLYYFGYDNYVNASAFSPDGRYFATGSGDGTARVVDLSSGQEVARVQHGASVNAIAFSPDGRYFVTGSDDGTARVVELSSGQEVAQVQHGGLVYGIDFSPDGRYFAIGSVDGKVGVIELSSREEVLLVKLSSWIFKIAFSPDGRYFATGSEDGTARVVELSSGQEVTRVQHDGSVTTIAFSPDGRYFATGSEDGTARMIELSSGKEVARVQHDGSVTTIAFSPDGRYFATGSWDGTTQFLLYHREDMVAQSCHKIQRNLSLDEWHRFLGKEISYHITCPGKYIPKDAQEELDRMQVRQNRIIVASIGGAFLLVIVGILIQQRMKRK